MTDKHLHDILIIKITERGKINKQQQKILIKKKKKSIMCQVCCTISLKQSCCTISKCPWIGANTSVNRICIFLIHNQPDFLGSNYMILYVKVLANIFQFI